jgi:hypothetical protein
VLKRRRSKSGKKRRRVKELLSMEEEEESGGGDAKNRSSGSSVRVPLEPQSLVHALERGQRELQRAWRRIQRPHAIEVEREKGRNGWVVAGGKRKAKSTSRFSSRECSRHRSLGGGDASVQGTAGSREGEGGREGEDTHLLESEKN